MNWFELCVPVTASLMTCVLDRIMKQYWNVRSFCFVRWFCFVLFRSSCFCRFVSLWSFAVRLVSFRCVAFRFVSFSFRFVSFSFRLVSFLVSFVCVYLVDYGSCKGPNPCYGK